MANKCVIAGCTNEATGHTCCPEHSPMLYAKQEESA